MVQAASSDHVAVPGKSPEPELGPVLPEQLRNPDVVGQHPLARADEQHTRLGDQQDTERKPRPARLMVLGHDQITALGGVLRTTTLTGPGSRLCTSIFPEQRSVFAQGGPVRRHPVFEDAEVIFPYLNFNHASLLICRPAHCRPSLTSPERAPIVTPLFT